VTPNKTPVASLQRDQFDIDSTRQQRLGSGQFRRSRQWAVELQSALGRRERDKGQYCERWRNFRH
jgi:hypothetical protein